MTVSLNPYLNFEGNAKDAIAFYAQVFGGEPQVVTFGQAGAGEHAPDPDGVMHGFLQTPAGALMVSDMPPGTGRVRGNDVHLSLSGDDETQLRGWWERLAEGGSVTVPLERQVWGDVFGACTDRFGVSWMVDIGSPQP